MQTYDEDRIRIRLRQLTAPQRTAFARSCAELLFPSLKHLGAPETVRVVRRALDLAGAAQISDHTLRDVLDDLTLIYPDSDHGFWFDSAVGQNAIGAAIFAVRVRLDDVEEDSVWAARQIYELADTVTGVDYAERAGHPMVQFALECVSELLAHAESDRSIEFRDRVLALRPIA